jgi:hypothetical protein
MVGNEARVRGALNHDRLRVFGQVIPSADGYRLETLVDYDGEPEWAAWPRLAELLIGGGVPGGPPGIPPPGADPDSIMRFLASRMVPSTKRLGRATTAGAFLRLVKGKGAPLLRFPGFVVNLENLIMPGKGRTALPPRCLLHWAIGKALERMAREGGGAPGNLEIAADASRTLGMAVTPEAVGSARRSINGKLREVAVVHPGNPLHRGLPKAAGKDKGAAAAARGQAARGPRGKKQG